LPVHILRIWDKSQSTDADGKRRPPHDSLHPPCCPMIDGHLGAAGASCRLLRQLPWSHRIHRLAILLVLYCNGSCNGSR
jgi:hypothetical protein